MMNEYSNSSKNADDLSTCNDAHDIDYYEQVLLMQAQETKDFAQYDQAMYDYYYYEDQQQVYDDDGDDDDPSYYGDDNDGMEWEQDDENHDDSALLRLILGVQMYLGETTINRTKDDTPLMDLQYKMYTYMKQRAFELGMDTSSLC